MTLETVLSLLDGTFISRDVALDTQVLMACGADLMSDVLSFTHTGSLLLTGLTNPQVVRTAEMSDIVAIVFVRGKNPPPETITLAERSGIPLLTSRYSMYESCGRLYEAGMPAALATPGFASFRCDASRGEAR